MSIFHLQGFSKMQFLCIHSRNFDTTGKLLQISIRHTQLECGLSKSFFTYNFYKACHIITPTWSTNMRQYMSECHTTLHQYDAWEYVPPRTHDFFLMDIILRSNLPKNHQEIFNRVRINLRPLTASDIVLCTSGTKLLPDLLLGKNHRKSNLHWPTVQKLPKKWIEIFCHRLINIIAPQLQSTPLGSWLHKGHQQWQHFCTPNSTAIHTNTGASVPPPHIPVDITTSPTPKILAHKPTPKLHMATQQVATPMTCIRQAPTWIHRLWRTPVWKDDTINKIIATANAGTLIATGQGAVRHQWGSYYWCFVADTTLSRICTHDGPVDGDPNDMKILRAAASYVLSALSILQILTPFIQNATDPIYIYTECRGLLNRVHSRHFNRPTTVFSDHVDIIYQIRELFHTTKLNVKLQFMQAVGPDSPAPPLPIETLMYKMHCGATSYYADRKKQRYQKHKRSGTLLKNLSSSIRTSR